MRYIFAVAIAIDLFFSALTGGAAYETISARLGRRANCVICKSVCCLLSHISPNHCQNAAAVYEAILDATDGHP